MEKFILCITFGGVLFFLIPHFVFCDEEYNILYGDNSFEFGYNTPDSFHRGRGDRNNVVQGEFGSRNPTTVSERHVNKVQRTQLIPHLTYAVFPTGTGSLYLTHCTGSVDPVQYTAGPKGFKPRGKNIARKYDLNQSGPRAVGNKDDPYFDPTEDPSYNFGFKTNTYQRDEVTNNVGDVTGKYSYVDDVGERHNVDFVAGKNTGFHVKTPFPDSNPRAYGPLFFKGRGKPIPRGRTSIQRQTDGSYRFVSSGPDQRRTETSDSKGHVRGSYTYLDDKRVQHTVHYIAGPETGYRVLKTVKGPHLPEIFPFGSSDFVPPNLYEYPEEVFTASQSGRITPKGAINTQSNPSSNDFDNSGQSTTSNSSPNENSYDQNFDEIFGNDNKQTSDKNQEKTYDKASSETKNYQKPAEVDDGSYKPSGDDDGSYKPSAEDDGSYKPNNNYEEDNCCSSGNSGYDLKITTNKEGAFITNLGKKRLSVPPGVSVRAHVQAIDLIPLRGKAPSPAEQLNFEVERKKDQTEEYRAESKLSTKRIKYNIDNKHKKI